MTRILFYVLASHQLQARLYLACKLAEKAHAQALHTYIHTDSQAMSEQLDELLWTYSDLSFLPHSIVNPQHDIQPPERILIGHDYEPERDCDYLINLALEQPLFFSRFQRMAEILDQNEDILSAGRKRYQFYRERGYNLEYHQLK